MLKLICYVFIGSGIGGVLRYLAATVLPHPAVNLPAPWPTLLVNITGCFIIGLIYGGGTHITGMSPALRTGLTAGFCGGLTTFSSFSYETLTMLTQGHLWQAIFYTVASVVLGIGAAWLGYLSVR